MYVVVNIQKVVFKGEKKHSKSRFLSVFTLYNDLLFSIL